MTRNSMGIPDCRLLSVTQRSIEYPYSVLGHFHILPLLFLFVLRDVRKSSKDNAVSPRVTRDVDCAETLPVCHFYLHSIPPQPKGYGICYVANFDATPLSVWSLVIRISLAYPTGFGYTQ